VTARSAVAAVLALAALAGCATPEGDPAAFREEALSTLEAAHSAVEWVHITVGARLDDKVFARSADDSVSSAEDSLSGTAGTFVGLQPPPGADDVRDTATKLLSDAQDAVEDARIAVRRDDRDAMRQAYEAVARASQALDRADEELP
jgi:basic membrane lipoprotein Med (substrate-binding protein (PBP1-ABC) superfamily)